MEAKTKPFIPHMLGVYFPRLTTKKMSSLFLLLLLVHFIVFKRPVAMYKMKPIQLGMLYEPMLQETLIKCDHMQDD